MAYPAGAEQRLWQSRTSMAHFCDITEEHSRMMLKKTSARPHYSCSEILEAMELWGVESGARWSKHVAFHGLFLNLFCRNHISLSSQTP